MKSEFEAASASLKQLAPLPPLADESSERKCRGHRQRTLVSIGGKLLSSAEEESSIVSEWKDGKGEKKESAGRRRGGKPSFAAETLIKYADGNVRLYQSDVEPAECDQSNNSLTAACATLACSLLAGDCQYNLCLIKLFHFNLYSFKITLKTMSLSSVVCENAT